MSAPPRMTPAVWAELALLAALWGTSFLAVATALRELGPLTLVGLRNAIAAAILWAAVLARGGRPPADRGSWIAFAVMGLLATAVPFSLIAWGQLHVETGLAAILNAATAVAGALAAAIFLPDERLTARRAAGVAIGFGGVVAIIGPGALGGLDLRSLGQGAIVAASVFYALGSVWGKLRLANHSPAVAAAGMLTCGALAVLPAALAVEGAPGPALAAPTWAAVAWLSAVGTSGAYLLYYRVLARAGAANVMLVTLLIPAVAVAIGALALGERIGAAAAAGYALLALGLAVIDGRPIAVAADAVTRLRDRRRGA